MKCIKIDNEKLQGKFYAVRSDKTALIVISGSDGGIEWASSIACKFASHGVSSLAVAYWGVNKTPKQLSFVAIETILYAVDWLAQNGYTKIGIYGFSKGAELALTAASLIPKIEFVIAVSPACCVFEGIENRHYSGDSSWTWKGHPLAYAACQSAVLSPIKELLRSGEFGFRKQYLEALEKTKNEGNTIKVENINGPILLLSARNDSQWPSFGMANMIVQRLLTHEFSFPVKHESFDYASHILCPVRTIKKFVYSQERKFAKQCKQARKNAFQQSLDWILGNI